MGGRSGKRRPGESVKNARLRFHVPLPPRSELLRLRPAGESAESVDVKPEHSGSVVPGLDVRSPTRLRRGADAAPRFEVFRQAWILAQPLRRTVIQQLP